MATAAEHYDATTLEAGAEMARYNRWAVESFAPSIAGRVLEIGGGIGTMSRVLRPYCSELVVIEPATNLFPELEGRFGPDPGVECRNGFLSDVIDAEPELFAPGFDAVCSFNVLEHIPDDVAVLRRAAKLLRPGGRVCLFVPSQPWLYGTVDAQVGHLRRYTKATMEAALRGAGLTAARLSYFDLLGIVPWFLVGRVLRRTTSGAGAGWYDRFIIPFAKAVDRVLGPPVGKNLIAVAEVSA